jgi:hypothetical protein
MKKLAVVLAVVVSGFVNAQPFKLSDKIGHTGEFWKLEILEDDSVSFYKVADADKISDSLKSEFIQTETLKKLNKIRKDAGMKPLIVDVRLKPAATQNAAYNRYCANNKIFQKGEKKSQGEFTLTHTQRADIPNFDEILEPWDRIKLVEPNVFASITEELTMSFYLPSYTYDYITTDVLEMYKICSAHWTALTKNPSWDCVYFYHDRQNGFCYIILGKYIK